MRFPLWIVLAALVGFAAGYALLLPQASSRVSATSWPSPALSASARAVAPADAVATSPTADRCAGLFAAIDAQTDPLRGGHALLAAIEFLEAESFQRLFEPPQLDEFKKSAEARWRIS